MAVGVIIVPEEGDAAARLDARRAIAFYGSTPSYRRVLAHHGWEDVGERLSRLAAAGRWEEMPALISDEILETFAVVGDPDTIGARLRDRYADLADRLTPYRPFAPEDPLWEVLLREMA